MVLEVTAKNAAGEKIFQSEKIYMPQSTDSLGPKMVLGPVNKLGLIRDTSIQPFAPKKEEFEIRIVKPTDEVEVTVKLTYQPRPGNEYQIHLVKKRVEVKDILGNGK